MSSKSTNLSIGIVGLPNVGKSTLFNALLKKQTALAANYPFATIEPNVGIVEVPDSRVQGLTDLVRKEHDKDPDKVIPAVVKFVDIAGLVKGAAKGEGLGNKFLSHIREVDAIIHVLRLFRDANIARAGSVSPQEDKEVINTELILADLEVLEKRITTEERAAKSGQKESIVRLAVYKRLQGHLNAGKLALTLDLSEKERELVKDLNLLTLKPVMYVFNVSEDVYGDWGSRIESGMTHSPHRHSDESQNPTREDFDALSPHSDHQIKGIPVCAKLEADLAALTPQEQKDYMEQVGIQESGLNKIIRESYKLLGLQTFFTYGPKEVHAWTIKEGSTAPEAAGKIHSDFQRGFIAAQVISYNILVKLEGWKEARNQGKIRSEGKDYAMREGDVVEFRFSV
ncbi:redox-regulated ATPase YchF [candidate division WWE3 bacterium]|nr:redox-regulated ATPase YchF [candidate division WWE3 bacterium]